MVAKRLLGTVFAAALLGIAVPSISEASFARATGSSYGGRLSNKRSVRTQQLTADPVSVLRGSTSTAYDPEVVSLDNVFALDGFDITAAYVGVDLGEGEQLITLGQYREGNDFLPFKETGYLQVFYDRSDEGPVSLAALNGGHSPTDPGYEVADEDGVTNADNTHTAFFHYIAEDERTVAHYRLYADDGERGFAPDSLTSIDDPSLVITDIQEANVAAALIPLPAAFGPGLIGLGVVAIVHRLRRRLIV
jgi:hypothetical protein